MDFHVIAALAIGAALVILWTRREPRAPGVAPHTSGAASVPALAPPDLADFKDVSRRHVDAAMAATRDFETSFRRTFDPPAAGDPMDPAARVRKLFAHRAHAQEAMGELRMRLPNDLARERRLAAAAEALDRAMLEHIEDARERLGTPLVHPGPVDDAWYGRWYRAANDLVA